MWSFWLNRGKKRKSIYAVNRELRKFLFQNYDDETVKKMRETVLNYFKFHQDELRLFLTDDGLDYTFEVAKDNRNRIMLVLFVPANHQY